jgi:HPt (histidine-containing phosphotransfer) domain-containing protein
MRSGFRFAGSFAPASPGSAHSLKSNAKAAGARNLGETAARLEAYCSGGRDVRVVPALTEGAAALLFAEWEEMKQALELFAGESG